MNGWERNVIWTAIWFIFIALLCLIFENGYPLYLLFLWIMGLED